MIICFLLRLILLSKPASGLKSEPSAKSNSGETNNLRTLYRALPEPASVCTLDRRSVRNVFIQTICLLPLVAYGVFSGSLAFFATALKTIYTGKRYKVFFSVLGVRYSLIAFRFVLCNGRFATLSPPYPACGAGFFQRKKLNY